jgi:hypothetical protein
MIMSKKSGYVPTTFRDAGTKEIFEGGTEHSFEAGAHANYEAAGLIGKPETPSKAKAGDSKPDA